MTKEKSCGALVFREEQEQIKFLLIIHRMGGHWSFPKGHIEQDETEIETALREVKEETGLDIELLPGYREQVSYSPRPGVLKDVVYFLGRAQNTTVVIQEEEISEAEWFGYTECKKQLTYDNDRMLLQEAKRYLEKNSNYLIE